MDATKFIAIIMGGFGVLAGVVAFLYKSGESKDVQIITSLEARVTTLEAELKECRKEHEKSDEMFILMRAEIDQIRKDRYK